MTYQERNSVHAGKSIDSAIYDEEERGGNAEESNDNDGLGSGDRILVKQELGQTAGRNLDQFRLGLKQASHPFEPYRSRVIRRTRPMIPT